MIFRPHSYQQFAIQKIIDQPASGLFLDMGLGKTVCTLTAINDLLYDYFDTSKALVIAPLRVAEDTWSSEVEKWDHLKHMRVSKVLGSEKDRIAALSRRADVYTINRENVEWLINYFGKKWPFDFVIVDELSSFKSPKAKRFRALRKVRPMIKRIVGLTGTPAPNSLLDLWAQIYLLDQGERLGKTVTGYRERYFTPGKRNQMIIYEWKLKPGADEAIYEKLSDLCISMKSEDWLELPERVNNPVIVKLSPVEQERYKQLERDSILLNPGGDIVANMAAGLTGKLLQLANGAVYDEHGTPQEFHNAKLEALDELIDAANGKPVLVFYAYRHDLARLKARYKKAGTLDTSKDIADWNAGKIPILLAHPASAGHGLNLQAGGHIIVWFSLPWSLELYQQGNKRLDRQGQTENVIVHHLIAEGTIDEDVMRVLGAKEKGQNALLEAVKARIEKILTEAA